jgi:hypothetical protein
LEWRKIRIKSIFLPVDGHIQLESLKIWLKEDKFLDLRVRNILIIYKEMFDNKKNIHNFAVLFKNKFPVNGN